MANRPHPNEKAHLRPRRTEKARTWWEKNKTKTLAEMQVDMLDWAIAAEAKNPDQVSDAERTYLAGLRTKIATSGKAESASPPRQSKE